MSTYKDLLSVDNYQNNGKIYGIATVPESYRKDIAVVFIHGFERFGYEQKRRILSQAFADKDIISLQFDFTGLGMSDGIYDNPIMSNLVGDLDHILTAFKTKYNINSICLIGHSLGACVAACAHTQLSGIHKLVFLAPALNQQVLNRYRFTVSNNKEVVINLENYLEYFDEITYQSYINSPQTKKANVVSPQYQTEMSRINYMDIIDVDEDILVIHGSKDSTVPVESVAHKFKNMMIIEGGDHDLEKPTIISQRVERVIAFVVS